MSGQPTTGALLDRAPGLVSYTYRNDFARDLPATLDKIRQLGITDMEFSDLFGHSPERCAELD